jgi:hypothetical protein
MVGVGLRSNQSVQGREGTLDLETQIGSNGETVSGDGGGRHCWGS